MENEFFDEPRKCPNCRIVTYCDSCPTCGKRLQRSSSLQWKKIYGHRIAGEETGILQPNDINREHRRMDVQDDMQEHASFQNAKHIDPEITFGGSHIRPSHPFFSTSEVKKNNNSKKAGVIISCAIAIIVIIFVFVVINSNSDMSINLGYSSINTLVQRGDEAENKDIILSDYRYDASENEAIFLLENTGNYTFSTSIEFYYGDDLIHTETDVVIQPNESFEYTIYVSEKVDAFEYTQYTTYDIKAAKPNFDYTLFNDYGFVEVDTEQADLTKEEIRILSNYIIEASSYDVYGNADYIDVTDGNGNLYEIYINNDKTIDVYVSDTYGDIVDEYKLTLDEEEIGTKL